MALNKAEMPVYQRVPCHERKVGIVRNSNKKKILITASDRFKAVILDKQLVLLGLLGFLLGRASIMNELTPFGIAYFVILYMQQKKRFAIVTLFIILGALTGNVNNPWLLVFTITVIAVCTKLLQKRITKDWHLSVLAGLATLSVMLINNVILRVPVYYTLMAVVQAVLVVVFTLIFAKGLSVLLSNRNIYSTEQKAALGIMLLAALSGLPQLQIYGLTLAGIITKLLVMLAAVEGGMVGAAFGVAIGIVYSISILPTETIVGSYAFSGLIAGIFRDFGKLGIGLGFLLGNVILAYPALDMPQVLSSIGEIVTVFLLFCLIPQKYISSLFQHVLLHRESAAATAVSDEQSTIISQKLQDFSQVFMELSRIFEQINSDCRSKENRNISALINTAATRVCESCYRHQRCWEKDFYQTYKDFFDVFSVAEKNSETNNQEVLKQIKSRCFRSKEMLSVINHLSEMYKLNYYWQKRLNEGREIVSGQLRGIANIIDNLASRISLETENKVELEQALKAKLATFNIDIENLKVSEVMGGRSEIGLIKKSCDGQEECLYEIGPLVSKILSQRMVVERVRCAANTNKSHCGFKLYTAKPFSVSVGVARAAKKGGIVSGDSFSALELKDQRYALIISDGMGVGPRAALESNATISMLEQLMAAGYNREFAVQTINSILVLRSPEETFATVDLAVIDLRSGEVEFIKVGSSPSFVKNKDCIRVIKSNSLPIGILNNIEVEAINWKCQAGDIIIMVTDGIMDAKKTATEKENWLTEIIRQIKSDNPQVIADCILEQAQLCVEGEDDDMTVLVAKIDG